MLSRRTSNMIFYGILIAILLVVVVARFVLVGAMNTKIADTKLSNRSLQNQIESKEQAVQNNKDIASDHLYELYDKVPEIYNKDELIYYTTAQLELLGIMEEFDVPRRVDIDEEVEFTSLSAFSDIQNEFKIVEVNVYFETSDLLIVDEFIDRLYSSEQIFVVNDIEYYNFTGFSDVGVNINFLAFYKYIDE